MCIFLFWSADVIFSTLTKNTGKISKFKKRLEKKNSSYPNFVFAQKLFITFFL